MNAALLTSVLLFARRRFLLAAARLCAPWGSLIEALTQEGEQFRSRMKPPLRARIDFFDPTLKGVLRRARVGSKSNYECEFHTADVVITFQLELCQMLSALPRETGDDQTASPLICAPCYRASSSVKRMAPVAIHRPAAPAGVTIRIRKTGLSQVAGVSEIWPSK